MTEAMPFLRKCDITFLRPPPFPPGIPQLAHISKLGLNCKIKNNH